MNDHPYLIWWTSQNDCERTLLITPYLPEYLATEFASRCGRAGRGRLWVPDRFADDKAMPSEAEFHDDGVCHAACECGGLVFAYTDYKHVGSLPGFVTTFGMKLVPSIVARDGDVSVTTGDATK